MLATEPSKPRRIELILRQIDSLPTLPAIAARLLTQEHVIYPRAVRWFAEGRLSLEKGVVRVSPDASQLVIGIDAQEAA